MNLSPRYLIDFELRRIPSYHTDILVIGSGIAGLSGALAGAKDCNVTVLCKGRLSETNTFLAQGGIAAVLAKDDSFALHEQDTLRVSQGLGHPDVIRFVVQQAPAAIQKLIHWGVCFDRNAQGELELAMEGAHSKPRIAHAFGTSTGKELQRALIDTAKQSPQITVHEEVFVLDLLTDEAGICVGALAWSKEYGLVAFAAQQTILATGGAGQIFRETTNPVIATGDGLAIAFRAGAQLRDLEFIQFHPTTLYIAGAARVLISEVVRGAGGVLRDRTGKAFMADYTPEAELAPRDVVARAISQQMAKTKDTNVYLDLSAVREDVVQKFPRVAEVCRFFDIDIRKDPIPVRPGAHYLVGGIITDLQGKTSLPGLFACGEVASSGMHGANRIGSNSLLEGLVFGQTAGAIAAGEVHGEQLQLRGHGIRKTNQDPTSVGLNLEDMTYSLKSLMGRTLGVERTLVGLTEAVERLDFWGKYLFQCSFYERRGWELINMLSVAQLIALSAKQRTESRGVHYRKDFMQRNDAQWQCHSVIQYKAEGFSVTLDPIEPANSFSQQTSPA